MPCHATLLSHTAPLRLCRRRARRICRCHRLSPARRLFRFLHDREYHAAGARSRGRDSACCGSRAADRRICGRRDHRNDVGRSLARRAQARRHRPRRRSVGLRRARPDFRPERDVARPAGNGDGRAQHCAERQSQESCGAHLYDRGTGANGAIARRPDRRRPERQSAPLRASVGEPAGWGRVRSLCRSRLGRGIAMARMVDRRA